jgi:HEAT repeat protein
VSARSFSQRTLALMDPAASTTLAHAAANDDDPEVRREAARGLARLGDRR